MESDAKEGNGKVKAPQRSEIRIIRLLICCGSLSLLLFFGWFVQNAQVGCAPLYFLLTLALLFKLAKMAHEWYYYWSPSVPQRPVVSRKWTVDILTTSCPGEPREMIVRTLKAMRNVRYPHTDYLCDEGDDPELKKICNELGVVYVTRLEKKDAKAGNINNALRQATGEICLVLDPDHVPRPEFLDRVLPYFEKDEIGFVQCVQAYGNQKESFIARGAAEQTYHFYGPMMMTMNSYGTAQAIGANCTFRRKALDSIGGHAAGLAEDMHTAMQLHAKGWESVYVPEILARGLVPATLSSYYKQQLKWSRGVFELLFRVFPKLCKNFTWRQRIHYFAIPWYFLFGLINLVDIAIPLLALVLAQVPWEIDLAQFATHFFPVLGFSLIIRFYVQRWLLEKHERGLHLSGGLLRLATWWIYLIGFIYSVFNIKVPYIPTPKEDEHQNFFRLCIPNLVVLFISALLIFYGLLRDWNPYSIVMASYSVVIMVVFAFTSLMSQQKFLKNVSLFLKNVPLLFSVGNLFDHLFQKTQQALYGFLQNGAAVLVIAVSLAFLSYSNLDGKNDTERGQTSGVTGGFYIGSEIPSDLSALPEINYAYENRSPHVSLFSFSQKWGDTANPFPLVIMNAIHSRRALPYINWEIKPAIYGEILKGSQDRYLKKCADLLRAYKEPVFMVIPEDSAVCKNGSDTEFINSWQYLYAFFTKLGISNITWVWSPAHPSCKRSYPGDQYVDWIALKKRSTQSTSEFLESFHESLQSSSKPLVLDGLESSLSNDQRDTLSVVLNGIPKKYKEVRAVVFSGGSAGLRMITEPGSVLNSFPFSNDPFIANENYLDLPPKKYSSSFIKGKPGNFELYIHQKPYYIKGVAYNTAHDWRDGFMPLTRRQVEKDFKLLKEMGANTIRRYGEGIYDKNVLNIANEYDLQVLYGFWFDPQIDYYKDTLQVKKYIREVEEKILELKDKPAVLAWSLGNETWGLLKHNFSKPYLVKVRGQYIKLIEYLARRIHELDPTRPVFSCIEHEEHQLASELVALHDGAPSVDAIGINSYYKEQISQLNGITHQFDSLRPYLVSEFGPKGYWKDNFNRSENGLLVEDSESEKAGWYKEQWKEFILGHKGSNIGGFAYCWHDRMEGSCTWFGLTDLKGRVKPSYFALKEVWTGAKTPLAITDVSIKAPAHYQKGQAYVFTAQHKKVSLEPKYEWYLYKDDFKEHVDNLEYLENGRSVLVKLPDDSSAYRLYLYVIGEGGKVSTSSLPIKASGENKNQ